MLKQLYVTHGYTANSQQHWFQWLKAQSEKDGFSTAVFDMPNSDNPDPQQWLEFHQQNALNLTPNTYFIAHSLGCVATLRYLQHLKQPIGGVILVSGFAENIPNLPELNPFTNEPLDFANLIAKIPQRLVIASKDDHIIQAQFSHNLAKNLQAEYIELDGFGHFLDRQGVSEFPLLYGELVKMVR